MEAAKPIISVGGIIYYFDQTWEPRFLIIKRYARSKKIERIAPKWKMQDNESPELSCAREVSEETWLAIANLRIKQKLWVVELKHQSAHHWLFEKSITYYLVEHVWMPWDVKVEDAEWFIGVYKRATIWDIMWLVYYNNLREIFRVAHESLAKTKAKQDLINSILW